MHRTPPVEVRRALRQEVGFGCPVSGCHQAFLTWHHFDPPWNVEQHHRSEGMIALCQKHHAAADQGVYSRNELRNLKQSLTKAQTVTADLPWFKRESLIRLGGCYSGGEGVFVAVAGEPLVWLRRADNGLLLLTSKLKAADGSILADIEDNMFSANPACLRDLEVNISGTRLKFWLARRSIGLDLSFKRVTLSELSKNLEVDRQRDEQAFNDRLQNDPWLQQVSKGSRETHTYEDPIATGVKAWVNSYCLDDEQQVPLLNFENLVLHNRGQWVVVHNGITSSSGNTVSYSASFGNRHASFSF